MHCRRNRRSDWAANLQFVPSDTEDCQSVTNQTTLVSSCWTRTCELDPLCVNNQPSNICSFQKWRTNFNQIIFGLSQL